MKIKIFTVGKPKYPEIFQDFLKRLNVLNPTEHIIIKNPKKEISKIKKETNGFKIILLDEHGKEFTSKELANYLEKNKNNSENLAFFIGGPDGHEKEIKELSSNLISLSKLTLPHDLAMIILVETLYRSFSILQNHPYHRE